ILGDVAEVDISMVVSDRPLISRLIDFAPQRNNKKPSGTFVPIWRRSFHRAKVVGNRRPLAFSMFIDLIASFTSASLFGFFLWPIPMKEQPGEIDNAEHPKSADRLGERGLALRRGARRVRFLLDPDRYVQAGVLRCGAFGAVVCGVFRVLDLLPA